MDTKVLHNRGEIWTFAGGKGGTGKSFLTSSIGIYLAQKQKQVVVIDFDLGGANLHTLLDMSHPQKNLTSFFEHKVPLVDIRERTGITNLDIITGDIQSLASDDIHYSQKMKLLRHVSNLEADYLLIDIGAGSHKNVIDTFLSGNKMMVVFVPEMIAIENLYHFLKNTFFRKLRFILRVYGYKELVNYVWERREILKLTNTKDLLEYLWGFPDIREILEKELMDFRIHLIINKVRSQDDVHLGDYIRSALWKHLGVKSIFSGFIEYDDAVWKSSRNNRPFLLDYKHSRTAKEIEMIGENLMKGTEFRPASG